MFPFFFQKPITPEELQRKKVTEGAKELKLNAARRHAFFSQLLQPIAAEAQQ